MACKQLTKSELDALLEQNPNAEGHPTLEDCTNNSCLCDCGANPCPCNPCTSSSECSDERYCCNNGMNSTLCLNRDDQGCRVLFRRNSNGTDISPGFRWMVQLPGSEPQYTNESPSPELASSYCEGQTYWNIIPVFGTNPCGFGYNCFFFYPCMFE